MPICFWLPLSKCTIKIVKYPILPLKKIIFNLPIRKLLQVLSLIGKVLLPIRGSLGGQHGFRKLLERRHNVDEVLDDAIHDGRVDALLELVELLGELTGNLLRLGRVTLAAGAQIGQLAGEVLDFVAELQDLGFLDARKAFGNLMCGNNGKRIKKSKWEQGFC